MRVRAPLPSELSDYAGQHKISTMFPGCTALLRRLAGVTCRWRRAGGAIQRRKPPQAGTSRVPIAKVFPVSLFSIQRFALAFNAKRLPGYAFPALGCR